MQNVSVLKWEVMSLKINSAVKVSVVARNLFPLYREFPVWAALQLLFRACKKQLHMKLITLSRERAALPIAKICFIKNRIFLVRLHHWCWSWGTKPWCQVCHALMLPSVPGAQTKHRAPGHGFLCKPTFSLGLCDNRHWAGGWKSLQRMRCCTW